MRKTNYTEQQLKRALEWFVRLQADDSTAQESYAFERWLALKPAHQAAFAEAKRLWEQLDAVKTLPLTALVSSNQEQRQHLRQNASLYSFILLVAAGLGVAMWFEAQTIDIQVRTERERCHLVLADNSQLDINLATSLKIHITPLQRRITLEHGEALFTVKHENLRPFIVLADQLQIEYLGTRFNVQTTAGSTSVAVFEGSVLLQEEHQSTKQRLPAGKRAQFLQTNNVILLSNADPKRDAAWLNGQLVFTQTPLEEVARQLQRYHAVRFVFGDAALAQQTLSGTFATDDLTPFLHVLPLMLPVIVERNGPQIRVTNANRP